VYEKDMTKISLAGAGSMARIHANAYSQMNDCELVGIFDVNEDSAARLAVDFGAHPYSDYDAMLSASPEIVDICTPTPWHADYAVRAAGAGANVLLEKPMALDVPTCERMIDAAESNNIKFMVAQVNRFFQAKSGAGVRLARGPTAGR
jgi:predicted dehydrogenase